MRALIIKTSSMGDIIHTLPALSDATIASSDISFDWVIEKDFQEIPKWHHAVKTVIPIALREWKKYLAKFFLLGEFRHLKSKIRQQRYDIVIDAQGLLKSAILTRLANAKQRTGLDWQSARESLASTFYQKRINVTCECHAINRTRLLFAEALGYTIPTNLHNFGINWTQFHTTNKQNPYLVFLHGTTWKTKQWPEIYWEQLTKIVSEQGFEVHVTCATPEQRELVNRLSQQISSVKMLPHLTIQEAAIELKCAKGVVSVDTGFGHLSAAMGTPTVTLYGPTNPNYVGILGNRQLHLAPDLPCSPCYAHKCKNRQSALINPPCFKELTPGQVWNHLNSILP